MGNTMYNNECVKTHSIIAKYSTAHGIFFIPTPYIHHDSMFVFFYVFHFVVPHRVFVILSQASTKRGFTKFTLDSSDDGWTVICGWREGWEVKFNKSILQSKILVQSAQGHGILFHDDVIKWKHFPRYWPFVRGIHRSPGNSPHRDAIAPIMTSL